MVSHHEYFGTASQKIATSFKLYMKTLYDFQKGYVSNEELEPVNFPWNRCLHVILQLYYVLDQNHIQVHKY